MNDEIEKERITVAIVDDHELLRDGIAELLGMENRLEVICRNTAPNAKLDAAKKQEIIAMPLRAGTCAIPIISIIAGV